MSVQIDSMTQPKILTTDQLELVNGGFNIKKAFHGAIVGGGAGAGFFTGGTAGFFFGEGLGAIPGAGIGSVVGGVGGAVSGFVVGATKK